MIALVLVLATVAMASVTVRKAEVWRDPIAFWEATVSQFDLNQKDLEKLSTSQALNNLGDAHVRVGSTADAFQYFEKAANTSPRSAK